INTPDLAVTPVIGYSPETSQTQGELHERTSRILPGVLFFQNMGSDFFAQGGLNCNFSTSKKANTFDGDIAFGWWVYRDSSLNVSGRRTDYFDRTAVPFITGLVFQIEFLDKHVINNGDQLPYDPNLVGQTKAYGGFSEGRNMYDMTLGGTLLLFNHVI